MCSTWEHQYHSQRGGNWFWEGSNLKLNPKTKKGYSLFSLVMEKFKKNLEWGGVNEKNREVGLKASGKGEGFRCPKKLNSLYIKKKTEGKQKYECYKRKVFFVSCYKQHIKFCIWIQWKLFKYVIICVYMYVHMYVCIHILHTS